MRIVVVGLGKVGRALAAQLTAEKHDIVVVDQNAALIDNFVNIYDVRGVPGNGASYDVQKEAFENGADLLIATTSSDEINILACMVAKKIGTQHTIARIRNPEYEQQLHFMRDELGLSMVVNPEKATAREMARVLRFPSAIKREQFCRQRFELVEYRLADDNPLVGLQLADLYRNIRVEDCDRKLIEIYIRESKYSVDTERGRIRNVTFEDITVLNNFHKPVISVHNGDDALLDNITFRDIVVEHEEIGGGDADEMPYLIDINIMQSGNWSTTKDRGTIRNVTIENVSFLEGWENASRIQGFDAEHNVENVVIKNLNLFGKTVKSAEDGQFEVDEATVSGISFQ